VFCAGIENPLSAKCSISLRKRKAKGNKKAARTMVLTIMLTPQDHSPSIHAAPEDGPTSGGAGAPGNEIPSEVMERYAALEKLACLLFWELERLDPTGHFEMDRGPEENWNSMPECERAFYITALQRALGHRDLVLKALERVPENDAVDGS
jgi:hypothetical protein